MPSKVKPIAQAAVLPYRLRGKKLEILLITSLGSGRWVLPKGHVEPDMTPRQSAIKEAFEEAGINGKVPKEYLGEYIYRKGDEYDGPPYRVEVFTMHVTYIMDTWPEDLRRSREWMSAKKAAAAVEENELRKLLTEFAENIMS